MQDRARITAAFRVTAAFRTAALLVIVLAGCGGPGPSTASSPAATPAPTIASSQAPAPTPSARASSAPFPAVTTTQIEAGGRTREYHLVAPPDAASHDPLPLLIVLHYRGETAGDIETLSGYDALATDPGVVVVYPSGYGASWNAGGCCEPSTTDGIDDVAFISALIDRLAATYPIDPDRIFVWGVSTGGQMAYRAACELSDRITALADISGNMVTDCAPTHPVSVIDIHGDADTDVPYDGCADGTCPSVPDVMGSWRQFDGCTGDPSVTITAVTVQTTYTSCRDGTAVSFVRALGEGHTLDAIQPEIPSLTWAFFVGHPRRGSGA